MSTHSKYKEKPVIGITLGDINGIGPEVVIKALADNRILNYMTPVIYGSTKVLAFYRKALNIENFNYSSFKNEVQHKNINVVNCWDEMLPIEMGQVTESGGTSSFMALEQSVKDLNAGIIDAVVTAPINKHNIQRDEFRFAGHTEYFASAFGAQDSLMFMVSEDLRIGVVTGHIPLKDVSKKLTKGLISRKLKIMETSLREDFGIGKPKIAVLGLNPHAGEDGLLGTEDQEVIAPVIKEFKDKGKLVFGPFPADGFFGKGQYRNYDGILAMYHDQGLIPFKTIASQQGVNFTAGLPIIRTSPDHGTAYDLAGKNAANENSMRAAIFMAYDILKVRMKNMPVAAAD
ncbi:4-hydroxythreonine-4-phosphate dehydrogenase PdxA [Fulvivirga sedimenti]|uniref:4-hydroxythreonine-4-phosphate dehydrogenase PdxA n=1 Tax=Fulvivirga sedimenti TaxID=2879465 RepID=A0A9X1KUS3_9BACT|nr:4-hydroxythreonine-4-phosphate dehydrogenase PdxA [Fulvivirga sedimenti]MCA6073833.1 4-hydroxythreonine-4-phosphate dehydrogenase PdxA [Fulvivirga sedimenti]